MTTASTISKHYAPCSAWARIASATTGDDYVVVPIHSESEAGRKGLRYAVQRRETAEAHGMLMLTGPLPSAVQTPKIYDFDGYAGCVTLRRSRATGTLVGVYHAVQAGMEDDPETPWMAVCEEHSTLVGLHTLAAAMASTDPREWCDDCRAAERIAR
jgi:hypothetical protein